MPRKQQTSGARLARLGLVALLAAGSVGVAAEEPPLCRAEEAPAPVTEATRATPATSALPDRARLASGLRAFVDPQTRALVVPPPSKVRALELSPALQQAFSTSSAGLVEVRLPDGTVKVNLEGRFMSATFATIGEDGTVRIGHSLDTATAPREASEAETGERSVTDETP